HRALGPLHRLHQRSAARGGDRSRRERDRNQREHLPGRTELAYGGELRLHRTRLLGQIVEGLEIAGVLLLIEKALLEIALDDTAIEIAERDFLFLLGHFGLLPDWGAGFYHMHGISYRSCFRTASTQLSTARPHGRRSTWWALL